VIATTLAVIFGTTMTNTNTVWAATIHCPTVPGTNQCFGTSFPDDMLGTSKDDEMDGGLGNDNMFGFSGNDKMTGSLDSDTMSGGSGNDNMDGDITQVPGGGNDNINGDSGDDTIQGFPGADILKGSSGNDRIFHFISGLDTVSDSSKDTIDCGSGNDEAWINTSQDGDTTVNCETVHAG
jgi:Ca2+-binding RTX toxin-like protein